ncbi:MAG: DUF366 family protein [Gemmatimonadota bacterium]|nr:MAG: DUF366 family protein [Gemmatimonadota bacterium]
MTHCRAQREGSSSLCVSAVHAPEEGSDVKSKLISDVITYTGDQLRSHWAFEQYDVQGDSIVAFMGPCDVGTEKLVDLADRKELKKIYSQEMLHFLVEHFDRDLEKTLLRQKLLITIIMEKLNHRMKHSVIHRLGDDLFDGDKKLSVSIATLTPVSTMIHVGINISSKNTPVRTSGLKDYGIEPEEVAEVVMNQYMAEMKSLTLARSKVKGVL